VISSNPTPSASVQPPTAVRDIALLAEGIIARAAALRTSGSVDLATFNAYLVQVKTFTKNILGSDHPYYAAIRSVIDKTQEKNYVPALEEIGQIEALLEAMKLDYMQARLPVRAGAASDGKAYEKMLDLVQVDISLFITLASAVVGLLVLRVHQTWYHPAPAFWATVFAGGSILFGVMAFKTIITVLNEEGDIRQAAFEPQTRTLLLLQILFFAVSVAEVLFFWLRGGMTEH
jgi:hypothetical protein